MQRGRRVRPGEVRPNGGLDAGPGELGREHPPGQLAELLERRVRVGHQRLELVRDAVRHRRPGHPQLVRQHDESRQHLVGDRLFQLPASDHVRLEDPGPGLGELPGGPIEIRDVVGELGLHGRVAERDRRLVGDGDQQSLVGRAQWASVEHVDLDAAERDVTVANGNDVCGRGVVGPLGAPGGRRDDHTRRRMERGGRATCGHGAAGRLRDGGQQLRGCRGVGQPAAEARERLVGLGPGAVGDPVGHPDHRSPQRLEGQRDERRREQREQQSTGAGVDQAPDHHDHRRVAEGGEREADCEHHRAVDHHLDVVEPVAQCGQRERHAGAGRRRPGAGGTPPRSAHHRSGTARSAGSRGRRPAPPPPARSAGPADVPPPCCGAAGSTWRPARRPAHRRS